MENHNSEFTLDILPKLGPINGEKKINKDPQ